jgi:hypothetical protein
VRVERRGRRAQPAWSLRARGRASRIARPSSATRPSCVAKPSCVAAVTCARALVSVGDVVDSSAGAPSARVCALSDGNARSTDDVVASSTGARQARAPRSRCAPRRRNALRSRRVVVCCKVVALRARRASERTERVVASSTDTSSALSRRAQARSTSVRRSRPMWLRRAQVHRALAYARRLASVCTPSSERTEARLT